MVTLTDPISRSNCVLRWEDYVANADNSTTYHLGNKHLQSGTFPSDDYYGGNNNSPISDSFSMGVDDIGSSGGIITSGTLRDATVASAREWTIFRRMRLNRSFDYNGIAQYQTQAEGKTWMPGSGQYDRRIAVGAPNVNGTNGPRTNDLLIAGQTSNINDPNYGIGLAGWYSDVRSQLAIVQVNPSNTVIVDLTVCHYSCHSSCHSSRGRR